MADTAVLKDVEEFVCCYKNAFEFQWLSRYKHQRGAKLRTERREMSAEQLSYLMPYTYIEGNRNVLPKSPQTILHVIRQRRNRPP